MYKPSDAYVDLQAHKHYIKELKKYSFDKDLSHDIDDYDVQTAIIEAFTAGYNQASSEQVLSQRPNLSEETQCSDTCTDDCRYQTTPTSQPTFHSGCAGSGDYTPDPDDPN